jgi:hypothetical protein
VGAYDRAGDRIQLQRAVSSMAEQVPFKHKVEGSSPPRPIGLARPKTRHPAGFLFFRHNFARGLRGLLSCLPARHSGLPGLPSFAKQLRHMQFGCTPPCQEGF